VPVDSRWNVGCVALHAQKKQGRSKEGPAVSVRGQLVVYLDAT
jgi:hypothetical protein